MQHLYSSTDTTLDLKVGAQIVVPPYYWKHAKRCSGFVDTVFYVHISTAACSNYFTKICETIDCFNLISQLQFCSAAIVEIKDSSILSRITFAIIFETTGRTQIPRQSSHSRKLPFLGILMIMSSVYSLGKLSLYHASWMNRECWLKASKQAAWFWLALKNSAGILIINSRNFIAWKCFNSINDIRYAGASVLIILYMLVKPPVDDG